MFWKKDKKGEAKKADAEEKESFPKEVGADRESIVSAPKVLPKEFGVLKGFYVSEKATTLNASNQYVFKVFSYVTKNEVKKQIQKSFDVRVKEIKIINMPRKKRNVGRHSGFKSGFKKAIVVLEKGHSIEGFQP